MTKVFNREEEKIKRRILRSNMPLAEVLLWSKLKSKQVGYKFRRQYSIGKFVIDFYCPQLKLAIEIDGESHYREMSSRRDRTRQTTIESFEISFLRFTNQEVYENIDGVLQKIIEHIENKPPLSSY
ncbi:MAG: DUF559 domain-containing protein [Nitrospirae bacterium]|nr:DUF559 domain-containing protein [Nitrospirota bacterium]